VRSAQLGPLRDRWQTAGKHERHCCSLPFHRKVVSERLGHSTVGITLDTCSHVLPNMQEEATAKLEAALGDLTSGSAV